MPESFINLTEGSGKKAHTFQKTIGANVIEDEVMVIGEQYLATYVASASGISAATANSHPFQLMAGGTLNLYIRRIMVYQLGLATTAAFCDWEVRRLTTAGTGGTAVTPVPFDSGDAAAGAAAMTLPTVKGTEGNPMWRGSSYFVQTAGASTQFVQPVIDINFDQNRMKGLKVAAGTTNGIALKNITAIAAGTVDVDVWFCEANF